MKEQILIMVEQMIEGDNCLLKLAETLPAKYQLEFLPVIQESIEKNQNIINSLKQ